MRVFYFYPIGRAKKVFAAWGFDCEAFSSAFTSFYAHHFFDNIENTKYYYIGLRVDSKDTEKQGVYELGGSIFINDEFLDSIDPKRFEKQLFIILLHEIMHWIQYTFYKWDDYKIVEGNINDNCEAERMCKQFEKQSRRVLQIYKVLKNTRKQEYR